MNIKDIKNLDKDQILELLGLETERSTTSSIIWTLGLVALGAIAGAGVALLLAPQSGRELRENVGRKFKNAADDVVSSARAKVNEAQSQAEKG
jgi:gas vesicle protein